MKDQDIDIQDIKFIPKSKNYLLIIDNNFLIIYDLIKSISNKILNLNFSIDLCIFNEDGNILGCLDDNLLTLYKIEFENYALNKLMVLQENCSTFHLRKKNEYSSYNLILINSKYIKFYYNISIDKYEIIQFSNNIKNSHYDRKFDYLYLFSNMLTIIKISDWSRILQIYIENDVFPLNSSGINN